MKFTHATLILLLATLPSLAGCSAVRMVGMAGVGIANSPLPPGSERKSLDAKGFVCDGATPEVDTFIEFKGSATDTAAFYCQELANRGWQQTKSDETGVLLTYEFSRESNLGAWTYARETLSLHINVPEKQPPNAPHNVWIWIHGKYAWDKPGELVSQGLGAVFGRYAEGLAFVFFSM